MTSANLSILPGHRMKYFRRLPKRSIVMRLSDERVAGNVAALLPVFA